MPNDTDPARQLAALFAQMCDSVDAYRTHHFGELTAEERERLEQQIQRLQDVHDDLTSTAIQDTLAAIKGDLDHIILVTSQAQQTLAHLNTFAEVIKIVSAASELGEDIAIADYGAIPQALEDILQAVPKKPDKN